MDAAQITNLISSVGFPIAACIYLIWNHSKEKAKDNETIEAMRKTIENNTIAIVKLCERLGADYDKEN